MVRREGQDLQACRRKKDYQNYDRYYNECQVIHFPWSKKNQYESYLEIAVTDLIAYAKSYYYNWEDTARDKFTSHTQLQELDDNTSPIFWLWYIINYRFHQDVSPIIDFYIAEYEDKVNEKLVTVLKSLRESYLSVYQVEWINNNVVSIRDVFSQREFIVERNFGALTRVLETGNLLLLRLVIIGTTAMAVGKPVVVQSDQLEYLMEEVYSFQTHEGIQKTETFVREYGEVICGLILDLNIGIKKNSIKSRSLLLDNKDLKLLIQKILKNSDFTLLERNNKWLKLSCENRTTLFKRLYVTQELIIIVAETREDLNWVTGRINEIWKKGSYSIPLNWIEGYYFTSEEEAEELLVEVMHDKYLEDWLSSPHMELENMTPLQAVKEIRGRVLLENLLTDLELLEIRARSRGEYYFPTSVIRQKLNLDKNKISKKLLHPEAVAIKVRKYRLRQELSDYVTAYNWLNDEYRQVAATVYDIFHKEPEEKEKLAWLLFIWNEFSIIYRPRVCKIKGWIAALEYSYYELNGNKVTFGQTAKKFGVATGIVSKNAQLILRHFRQHPLNFNMSVSYYPQWDELDYKEKIRSYDEVWQHLDVFAYAVKHLWQQTEDTARQDYYAIVNQKRKFWNKATSDTYEQFVKKSCILDCPDVNGTTIANAFWDKQARRFPPYLETAAFNIMMSYVGAYRITPQGVNELLFEDLFTQESYKVYGNFGNRVHDNIVPGMIGITRLLPLGDRLWVNDPMFIVLPDLEQLFEKNLQILMEEYQPHDISDYNFLKQRGRCILKAYICALDEMEQNAVNLMKQPLQIDWHVANLINVGLASKQLKQCRKFRLLDDNENSTSFIWVSFKSSQNYQWGYVLIKDNNILITTPPGKNRDKLVRDIRRAFKNEDIVVFFRKFEGTLKNYKDLEAYMVRDLAEFFNHHPELSLALLRQDELEDEESEWQQGIFLLKLGSLLMDYLKEDKAREK